MQVDAGQVNDLFTSATISRLTVALPRKCQFQMTWTIQKIICSSAIMVKYYNGRHLFDETKVDSPSYWASRGGVVTATYVELQVAISIVQYLWTVFLI